MLSYKVMPRPSPVSAHSISKRIPPRKRKSMERRKRGEGGRAVLRAGGVRVTTESERTIWVRTTTRSARAKSVALRLEKGSNLVVQCSPNKTCLVWGVFLARGAKRRVRKRSGFLDNSLFQMQVQKFKSRRFSGGRIFGGEVLQILYVRLTHPPIRAHYFATCVATPSYHEQTSNSEEKNNTKTKIAERTKRILTIINQPSHSPLSFGFESTSSLCFCFLYLS